MTARLLSILIGYFCGCFLTAELVARKFAGKKAAEVGETGNPGMANIMASLGFWPGIATLLGDMVKCLLAMTVCYLLFHKDGWIVTEQAQNSKYKKPPVVTPCPECHGLGKVVCAECRGTGGLTCPRCHGVGRAEERRK